MIAGHYATALVAQQRAPRGQIAFYLVASQLPDLAWYGMAALGLPQMESAHGPYDPAMMASHDLVPVLGWIVLAFILGGLLFRAWGPALAGAALVTVHELVDLLAGFPHNVLGPDTLLVGTGVYYSAPHAAVLIEALFAAGLLAFVAFTDHRRGVHRSLGTWLGRVLVFGGGIGSTLLTASMLAEFDPNASLPGGMVAVLIATYLGQIALLTWTETRPPRPSSEV
jgi:hypothetical protein